MSVYILELENGLKITETIGSDVVIRYLTSYAYPFIRSTNEAGETYQVVDAVGEIYNLPALPSEFTLESITGNIYLSSNGDELIENSLHLKPFRKDDLEDKVITMGAVTASSSIVNVALHTSGINAVFVNGNLRERYLPNQFNFTPVTTGIKVLVVYALDTTTMLYLAEGVEAPEAVEPSIPPGALFIARLIVSTTGVLVETGNSTYKQKQESDWRYIDITDASAPITLALPFDTRGSFYLTKSPGVGIPTIAGIKKTSIAFAKDQYFYGGREGLIFNATGGDVILNAAGVVDNSVFLISNRITPFTLKNNTGVKWKLRGSEIELLPSGSDPDLSGYLQKPTTDGTWVVTKSGATVSYTDASTLGKNISNTNLVWAADRTQNLNGKTLYFTGTGSSRFKVDHLFVEPKTVDSRPDKFSNDGVFAWFTPSTGIPEKIVSNPQLVEEKSISTTGVSLILSELNAFGTDRVDCPNLSRIYVKVGFKWCFINLTDVV